MVNAAVGADVDGRDIVTVCMATGCGVAGASAAAAVGAAAPAGVAPVGLAGAGDEQAATATATTTGNRLGFHVRAMARAVTCAIATSDFIASLLASGGTGCSPNAGVKVIKMLEMRIPGE
jgi:hypothetical protein